MVAAKLAPARLAVTPHVARPRAVYQITITAKSELLVGGGTLEQALSPFDIPVAKIPHGDELVPYIPGSTLKGLLRSAAEEALRAAAGSATLSEVLRNIDTEDITDELVDKLVLKLMKQFIDIDIRPSAIRNAQGANLYDKVVNTYGDAVKDILEKLRVTPAACNPAVEGLACELPIRDYKKTYLKALAKALGVSEFLYPCPVCRTFGAPGYASKVVVTSAYPNGRLGKDYYVLTRRHVAIDRYTGAAAEGKLFEVEYVTPGAQFVGYLLLLGEPPHSQKCTIDKIVKHWLSGEPPDCDVEKTVVEEALEAAANAMLGRRKSTGMGQVEIKFEKICERGRTQQIQCPAESKPLNQLCTWINNICAGLT